MFCLHISLCTTCKPGAFRCQKNVLALLELEFQMIMNHLVGAGDRTWVPEEEHVFLPTLQFLIDF